MSRRVIKSLSLFDSSSSYSDEFKYCARTIESAIIENWRGLAFLSCRGRTTPAMIDEVHGMINRKRRGRISRAFVEQVIRQYIQTYGETW